MIQQTAKSAPERDVQLLQGQPGRIPPDISAQITRRITALAMFIAFFFAVSKFFIWEKTHSVGILSSLVHSILDMLSSISSFIAVRYAIRPPDQNYRYGTGKAESFAAVLQICLIVIAALHLMEEAITHFIDPEPVRHSGLAISAMCLFIAISTALLIAQGWAIRKTGSIAVRGDRAHYMADMIANIFVITGIIFVTYTPFKRADTIVGIIMALWLLYTAFKLAKLAWAQLLDKELPDHERNQIIHLAMQDEAVKAVHDLRTRASGPHIHIQMRLDLDSQLPLSKAHDIIIAAEKRMMSVYKAADILIHPHPTGCQDTHGNIRFRSND